MKAKLIFLLFLAMTTSVIQSQTSTAASKVLVVYFSHSGNTRAVATHIQQVTGGDIFELQTVNPYPTDYDAVVEQAKQELKSGYKPGLKAKISNLKDYDVIFIGYPNWWNTFPAPVKTFLAENDLGGKTIVPFCTHGGGSFGNSLCDIEALCPGSKILDGLAISGSAARSSQDKVSKWVKEMLIVR